MMILMWKYLMQWVFFIKKVMPGYTTGMPSEIDKNRKVHAKKCFMLVSDIGSSDVL